MPDTNTNREDVALSLTLAVVSSSPGPLLLLDGQLTVIAASLSFCDAFDGDPTELAGRCLYELAAGAWDIPRLRDLMTATAAGDAIAGPCEIDLERSGQPARNLIVHARWLTYLDLLDTRILLAVSDVTEARVDAALKDAALRQNSVLLQEVRHRVANSLQIIASVLFQTARGTQSDETRGHLKDAHHRVMSVAALERLLSTSEDRDIEVRAYFTRLCENISASMIGELDRISLVVDGGEAVVEARVAMKSRPHRHRTCDQRPEIRLSRWPAGQDHPRLQLPRAQLDFVCAG